MQAILYNCLSTARPFRLLHILETLHADVVLLTGMRHRHRNTAKTPYETMKVGKYTGYVWGYREGALTNKSAGVGIFISGKLREKNVVEISSPEPWLQGRAGMIRCKGRREDITAVVGYPPPDQGRKQIKSVKETMA